MRHILDCRRTFVGVMAIMSLTLLGYFNDAEVAGSIATIVLAVAGANAVQKVGEKKYEQENK